MQLDYIQTIASELNIKQAQAIATIALLDDDATIPFISRYRKEATGSLDEVQVMAIRDRIVQLRELDKRRDAILKSLEERELLTDELKEQIDKATTMSQLEDIYLPYKPKRRTRATIAKEKGLEPLSDYLFNQPDGDVYKEAEKYINEEKEVLTSDDALAGARDIIAEWVSEDTFIRSELRYLFAHKGILTSTLIKGKETEGEKFKDYFEWSEPIIKTPSHRLLAIRRGEAESILSMHVTPPEADGIEILEEEYIVKENQAAEQVRTALHDSYKRLLTPSMETEIRTETKKSADTEAIKVFADNLRELLMSPPLGQKNIIAIDPGFRTGCKVVCLNKQGKLIDNTTIYPTGSDKQLNQAGETIKALVKKYDTEIIAVGNGTAGRETVQFVKELQLGSHITVEMVNESGASIYSASEVARDEFPDYDLTVRGSVSIGRRLMDPLAELVKIDAKSIGVGQYQHDVDQSSLKQGLDDTVISCVNSVGVELNTASKQLLTYVSGLGPQLAQNIIDQRNENGPFKTRKELQKVKRLGPKAYEQAAGFLRVADSKNPLDRSAVHPESYHIVDQMAKDLQCELIELMQNDELRKKIKISTYVSDKVGLPTLQDIVDELAKPGRDPREQYESFSFDESVSKPEDLQVGMQLPGIVTNVTNFGAFVDVGVHQDGLVHISELADKFVKDPTTIVKVHQKVKVTVTGIDLPRKRIALSMRTKRVEKLT